MLWRRFKKPIHNSELLVTNIGLYKLRQFKKRELMEIKTLCFMLDCTETVVRQSDDFINVYCAFHKAFRYTHLDDYKPKSKK